MLLNNSRYQTVGTLIGGQHVLTNKFKIKEEEWFGVTRISDTAGYPQGYGAKSFAMPLVSGAMSASDAISVTTDANMANATVSLLIDTIADLIAIGQLSASSSVNISTQSSIIGALELNAHDTVSISTVGELSSVLEAFVNDSIAISTNADLVGVTELSANDGVSISSNATIIGVFEGSCSTTISVGMTCNALFGEGYAPAQLTTLLFGGSGTLSAIGYMGGTTETNNGVLTPAQIWAYENRTLTDVNIDIGNVTVNVDYEAVADAVWGKTL